MRERDREEDKKLKELEDNLDEIFSSWSFSVNLRIIVGFLCLLLMFFFIWVEIMDYKGLLLQLKEHRDEQEISSYKYMSNPVIYIKYPSLNIIIVTVMVEDNNTFKLVKKGTVYISKNMPKYQPQNIYANIQ